MEVALFAAYTVLSGAQQGLLAWLLREFVPPRYSEWIDAALHAGGSIIYALVVGYVVAQHPTAAWALVGMAVLLRVALFDPALNLSRSWFSHREGRDWEPIFNVGTSALTDKALNAVAKLLHFNASVLSAAVRVAALAAAIWLAVVK
jgi:hypothetical protein